MDSFHNDDLSIISMGSTATPPQALLDQWQQLRQSLGDAELIWLTSAKEPHQMQYDGLTSIRVSTRSDPDGCWQIGVRQARHQYILLVALPNAALPFSTAQLSQWLISSPSKPLILLNSISLITRWQASYALSDSHYQRAFQLQPYYLLDRQQLCRTQGYTGWRQRLQLSYTLMLSGSR
ncbi:hypothetical protein [Celerinatantimonas yamalensis]|uniref:Chorismate lyase n=1 Tax=Celerinatantimonas yamalensis TaxID=559956 RepID=A0ABW9G6Z9_9GAMM